MKRKIITKTYLRDVSKYDIKVYLDEEDYYVVVKKLIKVDIPFIINDNVTVMDDGYYVFEVVPKNDNYAMRLFLNEKKEPLEYYFDITKNNGLNENNEPFYDDLYLDITYMDGKIKILNEDELMEAYNTNDVNQADFDLVYKMKKRLLIEIEKETNKCMKIDFNKYLDI